MNVARVEKNWDNLCEKDEFKITCFFDGSLKPVGGVESIQTNKIDLNDDFFLENDPVYIGKYESEILLNQNWTQKDLAK